MVNRKEIKNIIKDCDGELKDFQKETVKNVYRKLYIEKHNKHLVADEVGLGKTIVAKGLIAKIMERHIKSRKKKNSFKVFYICSNQALAGQNLKKLNIFKKPEFVNTEKGRLIFLAFKPKDNDLFQLSSLTPSTSFRLIKGTGIAEERKLIWLILSRYKVFRRGRRRNGLKLALVGNIGDINWWKNHLDEYEEQCKDEIRKSVFKKFKTVVAEETINLNKRYYSTIGNELDLSGSRTLQDILIRYSELLRVDTAKKYRGTIKLLGKLRELLTEVCLDYLEADLFILDEFQRFQDLIKTDDDNHSDTALIAKKVFNVKGAKILLLSATPFKPFTNSVDDKFNENHFKEFQIVLSFLFNHNKEQLELYEKNRKEFFELLRRPEKLSSISPKSKENLEKLYRKVISRTERLLVSDDKNTLVRINKESLVPLDVSDVKDFKYSDAILQEMEEKSNKRMRNIIDYAKSSPFPFSFLDGYKVKNDLKEKSGKNKTVQRIILKNKKGWLNLNKIQRYKPLEEIPNSKMRCLLKESVENGLWKQLWIAPSLPYYDLCGSFEHAKLNSKILLFSAWKMVPRAVSSLISYEVEQRSIGNKRFKKNDKNDPVYTPSNFPGGSKKRRPRKPTKILSLKMKEQKPQKMSAFTLLYPSLTLSSMHNIQNNIRRKEPLSLMELKKKISAEIGAKIDKSNLRKYCSRSIKKITKNWYWAAPLLLDKFYFPEIYNKWLHEDLYTESSFLLKRRKTDNDDADDKDIDGTNIAAQKHMDELKMFYKSPEKYLGTFPDDLIDVLTLMVIASPAVTSLRTIQNIFKEEEVIEQLNKSLDIATEFYVLFDKPESISVVQLNTLQKKRKSSVNDTVYWHDVLYYCVDGNLQSVLDEFSHLIYADYNTLDEFGSRLADSINIRTSSLMVDSAKNFVKNKKTSMRCHFAVDFGNQNMDRKEGRQRVESVLEHFNSPFRPFVLATTSIGQEGLDFHFYCRKVMHWNLPSNPIDIEQREGRVNRYKGLVIRQNIVIKYKSELTGLGYNVWEELFNIAKKKEGKNKPDLVPFWHVEADKEDGVYIERIIPILPYSKDVLKLNNLLVTLTLYRLTLGQPRQEELVETLYDGLDEEQLEELRKNFMINLSPWTYGKRSIALD